MLRGLKKKIILKYYEAWLVGDTYIEMERR